MVGWLRRLCGGWLYSDYNASFSSNWTELDWTGTELGKKGICVKKKFGSKKRFGPKKMLCLDFGLEFDNEVDLKNH